MDQRSAMDKDTEVDLESGLPLIGDDSKKDSPPDTAKQGKTLFSKISGGFVGGSLKDEDRPSLYCNKSNSSEVNVDVMKVTDRSMMGQDSVSRAEKTAVKEKRKKVSNKRAPKPPRPPQAPTLDAGDHKLIREISELAMLKRARIERMRALANKMNASKAPLSFYIYVGGMVFALVFIAIVLFQGNMSSGESSVASFQGSPVSARVAEGGLISVQYQLNPTASDSNAPGIESQIFVQQVAGSDLPQKLRRDSG